MVNHDIVGFYVAVHDTFWMAVIKCFENFKHVVPDVVVSETLVKFSEVRIACVDKFSDNRGSFSQGISHNIYQLHDIDTFLEGL